MIQNQIGNNTTSSSPFVTAGDVIYFRGTDDKLWKVNSDGSGQLHIGNNTTKSTPFVTPDGWVWFQGRDNKLWKVFNDGSKQSQPRNNRTSSPPTVVGDWVYFRGTDDKLWRMKTDGSVQEQIGHNTTKSTPFVTPDAWVWFQGTDNKLWRVFSDGTGQSQLDPNTTASTPVVGDMQISEGTVGEWVYFQGTDNKLWRYFQAANALRTPTQTSKVRCYFLPYEKNWLRLKLMSVPASGETAKGGLVRRTLFRNAVLSNLAHLKIKPGDRGAIFQSLVNHVAGSPPPGGSVFTGLESVYLTLLADTTIRTLPQYAESLKLWNESAAGITADVGAVFYNEASDRLSLLSPATLQTLKPGGAHASFISSGAGLATNIESIADAMINQPFSKAPMISAPIMLRMKGAAAAPQGAAAVPQVSEQVQETTKQLALEAAVLRLLGLVLSAIPATELLGLMCNSAAATVGVYVASQYFQGVSPSSSTVVTVDGPPPGPGPVCTPDGIPVCTPDGTPVMDSTGEMTGDSWDIGLGDSGALDFSNVDVQNFAFDDSGNLVPVDDGSGGGGGGGCFVAETPVLMGDGSWKNIADVSPGEQVIWFDHLTGKQGKATVIAALASRAQPTWRATFEDGTVLHTTARQRFLHTVSQQPIAVTQLAAGHQLVAVTTERNLTQKKIVEIAAIGQKRTVYNLKVEAPHKFTVGRGKRLLALDKY